MSSTHYNQFSNKKQQAGAGPVSTGDISNCAAPAGYEDARTLGLSTVHNGTLSHAMFWLGGSKVRVCRDHEIEPGKVIGGKRGEITGFSKASRKRLMEKIGQINRDEKPVFVTLTFPDEFHPYIKMPAVWKKYLKRFMARLKRRFPNASGIWRLELEDRKSGRYVGEIFPHYHLLVYGAEYAELLSWVPDAWWECCGRLSEGHRRAGTRIEVLRSIRGAFRYVSKYMAKVADFGMPVGRVWGVFNVEKIPWVRGVLCQLTEREAVQLIRYLRRYAHIKGRDYKSLTVMCDAEFWWRNLDRLLYPY